jgi:hypothetical protein
MGLFLSYRAYSNNIIPSQCNCQNTGACADTRLILGIVGGAWGGAAGTLLTILGFRRIEKTTEIPESLQLLCLTGNAENRHNKS